MHKLYLIPSELYDNTINKIQPVYNQQVINTISTFIVENIRTSRRFLIKAGMNTPIDELTFYVLNKHTKPEELHGFLNRINEQSIGLLSEAGTPCIADPGAQIVELAHKKGIVVEPLVGANSIVLALMASGLNGQCFSFNGYLPVKPHERQKQICMLENRSRKEKQTQVFIEAPYRNNQLLKDFVECLAPQVRLCIACNVTGPDEFIKTKCISEWKKNTIDLHKKPTIFLFQA